MDIEYLLLLQQLREALGGIFDSFMMQMTALGEAPIAFLLLAAVYWCLDKQTGQFLCLTTAFTMPLNQFLKALIQVDRPWVRDSRIQPVEDALPGATGYSFPSGHTHRATAVWGALGFRLGQKKKTAAAVLCWSAVALVGFSRNYLGVHTPQDVLVAFLTGLLFMVILNKVQQWADGGKNRDIAVAAVGCGLCGAALAAVGWISFAGLGFGFLIGWVLERHFIQFRTDGSRTEKCVRFAIGGGVIWYILKVFPATLKLVMASKPADLLAFFLMSLFVTAIYPFFFCKKERHKAGIAVLAGAVILDLIFACIAAK